MLEQLKLHLQTQTPLLAVETHDESRAIEIIRQAAIESKRNLYEWSITGGLIQSPAGPGSSPAHVVELAVPRTKRRPCWSLR